MFAGNRSDSQKGQALLVAVLILVVALTVGLSVATRAITNLRTSTQEDNSQQAFSAAEAGVERLLKCSDPATCKIANENLPNDATINAHAAAVEGTEIRLKDGATIQQDEGADVWLSDPTNGYSGQWPPAGPGGAAQTASFQIFWSSQSSDPCEAAAIEVIEFWGSPSNPKSWRYTFDPCNDAGKRANNFSRAIAATAPGDTVQGKTYTWKTNTATDPMVLGSNNPGLFLRVIPLYANATIGVKASMALPSQGVVINSTGVKNDTARKIVYFQGYPSLPLELLAYILLNPSDLNTE